MEVFAAIAIAGVVFLLFLRLRARGRSHLPASSEADLLNLCRGDASRMERLIAFERTSNPAMSRSKAIDRAVYRLRRDKR